jgi:hypothetical protein
MRGESVSDGKPKTSNPALRLMLLRKLHIYISVFIAPSLLFFAGTGAFQTFRIPDRKDAPVLLQKLARVHRDDVFAVKPAPPPKKPEAKAEGDEHAKPAAAPAPKPKAKASTTAVKWYFAIVSIAILVTTILGLWMALAYHREKRLIWALLIAGAAIPMILLAL